MKKLLLTSTGFTNEKIGERFSSLINKRPDEIKVVFVPTAAREDIEWKYVEESKQELIDIGICVDNLNVLDLDRKYSYEDLADYDAMYVCGGNTFYLLKKIKENGFDQVMKEFIKNDKVYVGVSAGSIIPGPDIGIAEPFDVNDVGLIDFSSLNIVDFVVSPHYVEEEKEIVDNFIKNVDYKVIPITDDQAVEVIDEQVLIIE
jgi:peptidase E